MASCDLLDLRCIFVNELVGSAVLSVVLTAILVFVFADKNNLGFRTTLLTSVPFLLMFGLILSSFSAIYAFITIIVGIMLGAIFMKIIS